MVKPTREDLLAARQKTLPDVIASNLKVLFCGINPGLYTAATGCHFARPGNRFWKALHDSGFTPSLLLPCQQEDLLYLRIGITNLVPRATAAASELSKSEIVAGAYELEEKARRFRPQWIAFVGIGAYRVGFRRPAAALGRQPEHLAESGLWVLPNTSGLNANHQLSDFARLFSELKAEVDRSLT